MMQRLRDLIDRYGGKALRYSSVSVVGVVMTEVLLVAFLHVPTGDGKHLEPWIANALAVTIASLPVYLLNRAWVWEKHDSHSFTREVAPFWGMSLLGLVLSTIAVAFVSHYSDAVPVLALTNIAAFGVLWVAKFVILEKVLFAGEPVSLVDAEPWVAADPRDE